MIIDIVMLLLGCLLGAAIGYLISERKCAALTAKLNVAEPRVTAPLARLQTIFTNEVAADRTAGDDAQIVESLVIDRR